ncbi:MAG: shikimate dehydrogenase [Flavipsychrobacter sp.]
MTALYGLIGYPLSHSFSPAYFNNKFATENIDGRYDAYAIPSVEDLKTLLQEHPQLKGLNVTIPYKEQVLPLLNEIDAAAREIGAVNCIKIEVGKLIGYNTDHIGFVESLKPLLQPQHTHALILGTGGAAKAVMYALKQLGIKHKTVSRIGGDMQYADVDEEIMDKYRLIINTTPLGMYPAINTAPEIPYQFIDSSHLLYDLVYNPEETLFLKKGKQKGATIKNGYEMLILQAEASWQIWNTNR